MLFLFLHFLNFLFKIKPNAGPPVAQQPQPVAFKPVVTKEEIKLEKKVKGVTWNRILLMPKEAPNRVETVWDNIKEVKIDIGEIANLFEIKVISLFILFVFVY